ncbi:MAG: efflux RND transporter periplasmic adaptor subunit [Spirochaetia bacterium]|nr:efflux RND transporter periplasmic adaptor subunit [Spirochaetota bacterium]MCX8096485.1 efflux RND transporter periplasmic adaptor subunit [Spirochaetota bacterium]MDW8113161.1 efflux RND transporter periplasmic adaptor subunit [Spirochaetia bacterium]
MKGKTRIAIIIVSIVLAVVVGIRLAMSLANFGANSGDVRNLDKRVLDVTVVGTKVKVGKIEKYISLAGEMRGIEEAFALPDVPGKVARILVREGSYVSRDQAVAYIDRSLVGFSYNLSPVRSPISGRVGNILVSDGQFVSQTTPIATIVNDTIMEVVLLLPETYITKVKRGDKAIIEVTPYPNEKFVGYVYSTDIVIDRGTRTLKIKVRVDNSDRKLISGMFCSVKVLVDTVDKTSYVPNTSIRNINGESVVYTLIQTNIGSKEENLYLVVKKNVIPSISDGTFTAVSGVSEGEMVVSLGAEYLKDGVIVRVIEE